MNKVQQYSSLTEVADFFSAISKDYVSFYDNQSFLGQYFSQRLAIVYRHLRQVLESQPNPKLLDLGCGPGMLFDYLHRQDHHNWEFWGTDIAEGMIRECTQKFGHLDNAHFAVGQVQNPEFPDQSFDAVICLGVLEYLEPEAAEVAIAQMNRVLKPNGVLILSLTSNHSLYGWNKNLISKIKRLVSQLKGRAYQPNVGDGRRFEEHKVRRLLLDQSLDEVETEYFGLNLLFPWVDNKFPKLSTQLYGWCDRLFERRLRWPYSAMVIKAKKSE
ncbi:MAG: class I SAM-dependent methyltransferase [Spirulina sp. SIO3F2]|nr:class I SAM-dependent methyltransferase [Spirulina sp. SIO3F2]